MISLTVFRLKLMTSTSRLRPARQIKVLGPYSFSLVFEPAKAYCKAITKSMERPGSYTTLVWGRGEAEPPARQPHRLSERVPECSRSHSPPLARYGSGMAGAAGSRVQPVWAAGSVEAGLSSFGSLQAP